MQHDLWHHNNKQHETWKSNSLHVGCLPGDKRAVSGEMYLWGGFALVAPCSGGRVLVTGICVIILQAKFIFNHQLKSASRRQIGCSLSMYELPTIFSRRTLTPSHHCVSGSLLVVAKLMLVI